MAGVSLQNYICCSFSLEFTNSKQIIIVTKTTNFQYEGLEPTSHKKWNPKQCQFYCLLDSCYCTLIPFPFSFFFPSSVFTLEWFQHEEFLSIQHETLYVILYLRSWTKSSQTYRNKRQEFHLSCNLCHISYKHFISNYKLDPHCF